MTEWCHFTLTQSKQDCQKEKKKMGSQTYYSFIINKLEGFWVANQPQTLSLIFRNFCYFLLHCFAMRAPKRLHGGMDVRIYIYMNVDSTHGSQNYVLPTSHYFCDHANFLFTFDSQALLINALLSRISIKRLVCLFMSISYFSLFWDKKLGVDLGFKMQVTYSNKVLWAFYTKYFSSL